MTYLYRFHQRHGAKLVPITFQRRSLTITLGGEPHDAAFVQVYINEGIIMKRMSSSVGSFAGPNPNPIPRSPGTYSRQNLSATYFKSATFFVKMAGQIERDYLDPNSSRHGHRIEERETAYHGSATSAILHSFAAVAASINQFLAGVETYGPGFGGTYFDFPTVRSLMQLSEASRRPPAPPATPYPGWEVLERFQATLQLASKPMFDPDEDTFADMVSLALLKEQLMDFYPERSDKLDVHQVIEDRLAGKFPETQFFSAHEQVFFPSRCLSYGCAAWSLKVARAFLANFYDRLGIPHVYAEVMDLEGEEPELLPE